MSSQAHDPADPLVPAEPAAEEPAAGRRGKNVRGLRTRAQLLEAATECFSEYGYGRTRIADVVFRAGVSQGNFYRHFASKDEIFDEALRPGMDELAATFGPLHDAVDRESVVAHLHAYLTTYARHRLILRVMREAAAANPHDGFGALWRRRRAGFVDRIGAWVRELARVGAVAEAVDADLLAEVLGAALEQTAYVHVGLAEQTPRRERVAELARAVGEVWWAALSPR